MHTHISYSKLVDRVIQVFYIFTDLLSGDLINYWELYIEIFNYY